jgi:site-specific DNA-methyltransferase (adenine-specific)
MVWNVNTQSFQETHFATFPSRLVEPCVQISSKPGDFVLDTFFGPGTVGLACTQSKRQYAGAELNPEYAKMAADRLEISGNNIMKVAV